MRVDLCFFDLLLNVLLATLLLITIDFVDKLLVASKNIGWFHRASPFRAEETLNHHSLLDAER